MQNSEPIGIFDSGIGGLTVAHAIKEALPYENLIYFGDTAHLPYGDKSTATIQAYAIKIADFFLQKKCKVIVIACNSASAAAYELLKEYVASKAKVVNVIDPMVGWVTSTQSNRTVGVIGTKQTINSGIYASKINQQNTAVKVQSLATPLLVPMIEEGFLHNKIAHDVIGKYLADTSLQGIESLVLGCTHYPLIKRELSEYYKGEVDVLDSSTITAVYLSEFLKEHSLKNANTTKGTHHFFVSDLTDSFIHSAQLFFGAPVKLEMHRLWE